MAVYVGRSIRPPTCSVANVSPAMNPACSSLRLGELPVDVDPEHDAVADVEAGGLAGILRDPDELARQPLPTQRGRDLQLERHGETAVGGHAPALEHRARELDVLRADRDGGAIVDRHLDALARREALREGAVIGGEGRGERLHAGAEPRAEHLEVRLRSPRAERVGGGRHPDRL